MKTTAFDAAKSALGGEGHGDKKARKLKLDEVRVKRGHKGGYIARHHHKGEDGEESGEVHEYPLPTHADLLKHMAEHMPEEAAEMASGKEGAPSK